VNKPGQGQILAACLGIGAGLGLILVYFLGWSAGIPVVFLGLGGTLLFIAFLSDR